MNPLRFLVLAVRVLIEERRKPDPQEAERVRRSVRNAIRERERRGMIR